MEVPLVYEWFQHGISRTTTQSWFVEAVIKSSGNQRILDIGCGTATVLRHLNGCDYVGVDHNPEYIAKARARYGDEGSFHCTDINDATFKTFGKFDNVLLLGVLHHLSDHEVNTLTQVIPDVLNPDGVVVTMDPAIVSGQHPIARLLAKLDRGRYARSPKRYRELLESHFEIETEIVRHDLLKVPYTHTIFRARPKAR
jgi:SAM-dependent methyltransferase